MLCHAIRSYYGSTQLLEYEGEAGLGRQRRRISHDEHLRFDGGSSVLGTAPESLGCQKPADWFVDRYSYEDKVRFPGDKTDIPAVSRSPTIWAHELWSRPGYSSYEKAGLNGCFSYMTHEQLVNWLCCATVYVEHTGDQEWLEAALADLRSVFRKSAEPRPSRSRKAARPDATRFLALRGGAEITPTIVSMFRWARRATTFIWRAKSGPVTWRSKNCSAQRGDADKAESRTSTRTHDANLARSCGRRWNHSGGSRRRQRFEDCSRHRRSDLPVFTGCRRRLESDGEFGRLMAALKRHLHAVLRPVCACSRMARWKLSSTSDNSWLSKIYLCQFVARDILGP